MDYKLYFFSESSHIYSVADGIFGNDHAAVAWAKKQPILHYAELWSLHRFVCRIGSDRNVIWKSGQDKTGLKACA